MRLRPHRIGPRHREYIVHMLPSEPTGTKGAALVTGASSGIGRATAERLAEAGYRVAVNYATNDGSAEAIASAIGGRAYQADVADATAVATMVAQVERDLGPICLLVSNAGFYEEVPIDDISDEQWTRMLRVHLGGAFHLVRAVVPSMRAARAGSIVIVASELALIGNRDVSHYVAAKGCPHRIRTNPGSRTGTRHPGQHRRSRSGRHPPAP